MRPEKQALVDQLREEAGGTAYLFLSDYRGLPVAGTEVLRRRLGAVSARYRVVRNRLFQQVTSGLGLAELDPFLSGPSAVVWGEGDPVAALRVLRDFSRENEGRPAVKAGFLEGALIPADQVLALADLPSRQVLRAILVGTLAAPMTRIAGVLQQKLASLVYVLNAVVEKKGS